jgi:hypothetical protein
MSEAVTAFPSNGPRDRYTFWNEVVDPIQGWLLRPAAIHTMDILEDQVRLGVTGSLLEIGVFGGKYFSVLARYGGRTDSVVLGIDPFTLVERAKAEAAIAPAVSGDPAKVILHQGYSGDYDADEILAMLGGARARFISVDGSHDRDDVFYDLGLAEALVAPGGVVAVDDFLNYVTPGVNEAIFAFYATPRRLVPFAFIRNKLFLTSKRWAQRYRSMLKDKMLKDEVEEHSRFFRARLDRDPALAEGMYWGSKTLMVP